MLANNKNKRCEFRNDEMNKLRQQLNAVGTQHSFSNPSLFNNKSTSDLFHAQSKVNAPYRPITGTKLSQSLSVNSNLFIPRRNSSNSQFQQQQPQQQGQFRKAERASNQFQQFDMQQQQRQNIMQLLYLRQFQQEQLKFSRSATLDNLNAAATYSMFNASNSSLLGGLAESSSLLMPTVDMDSSQLSSPLMPRSNTMFSFGSNN